MGEATTSPPSDTRAQGSTSVPTDGHVDRISESARSIVEESRGLANDVATALDIPGRMERHPYQTLLIAAGVGYVLGGGLFTPLTLTLLKVGVRVAAVPLMKQELAGLAEVAITGQRPT